jgi:hypothetical protein
MISSYGFETQGDGENAVWYFRTYGLPDPPKVSRFYQLADLLKADYKIEDITTAIETSWKMLGVKSPPELKFHPETKLLIAVGPEAQLRNIDELLVALRSRGPKPREIEPAVLQKDGTNPKK